MPNNLLEALIEKLPDNDRRSLALLILERRGFHPIAPKPTGASKVSKKKRLVKSHTKGMTTQKSIQTNKGLQQFPKKHRPPRTTREWAWELCSYSTAQLKSIIDTEPDSPRRRGAQATLATRTLRTDQRTRVTSPLPTGDICLLMDVEISDNAVFDLVHKLAKKRRTELMHIARCALSPAVKELASQNLSVCNNLTNPSNAPERRSHTHRQQGRASHLAKGRWGYGLRRRFK